MTNNESAISQMVEWLEGNGRIIHPESVWIYSLEKARSLLAAEQSLLQKEGADEAGLYVEVEQLRKTFSKFNTPQSILNEVDNILSKYAPHAPKHPHSVVDDKGKGHALTYCGDCSHYKKPSCAVFPKHTGESEGTYRGRFGCNCYHPSPNKGNDKGLVEELNKWASVELSGTEQKEMNEIITKFREAK